MNVLIMIFKEVLYLAAMSCVVIVLLLALKKLFRKALSPKWHCWLWAVLILRLLLPFQPASTLSIYNVFYAAAERANLPVAVLAEPQANTPAAVLTPAVNQPDGTAPQNHDTASGSGASQTGGSIDTRDKSDVKKATFFECAAIVWLAGMAGLVLYMVIINAAFASRVRRRYAPLRDARILHALDSCRQLLRVRREIPVLTSRRARTPALYGLFRPKILVCEESLAGLGDDELRHIFLHELSHYKRKDIAVNWLLTALQIVYFFNPLVWLAFHKLREDGEIACDAAALQHLSPDERQAYGGTVIKLIRLFSEPRFIPVTAGMAKNKSSVKRRILMIGNFKKSTWTGALLALLLIAAVALVGLTGCSATSGTPSPSPSASADPSSSPDTSAAPSDSPAATDDTSAPSPSEAAPSHSAEPSPTALPSPTAAPMPSGDPSPKPTSETAPAAVLDIIKKDWVVSKVLAYGSAGTYSKADAEKLIGKTVSFAKDEATLINDDPASSPGTYKNPAYHEGTISSSDFMADFRMSFDKLGITSESVAKVDVSPAGAGGCTLLVKDDGNLVLIAGGTAFELTPA